MIYTLACADDMVLLVVNEEEMRSIERLKGYLERKRLELNTEKTKSMRFRKENGRKGLEMEGQKDREGKGV